ncbi:MAG: hypothetical protein HXY53_08430 [Nitrospirae bacterium]|nr:hypothetical protein [Nitrospirota bacterium]
MIINVYGESEHGLHGAQIEINVNKNLFMESFKKPLVAKYTKAKEIKKRMFFSIIERGRNFRNPEEDKG